MTAIELPGNAPQPSSMINATVTANTALGNAAAGTQLPLSLQEILGADISIINNAIQFNAAGTYHVVMNATFSSTAVCWVILNAWFPGGGKKSIVCGCVATPFFDEGTISFNYTASAGDQIYFSAQANIATGATCDSRSQLSVTKVTVGSGPQGPQGPPGVGVIPPGEGQLTGVICTGTQVNSPAAAAIMPISAQEGMSSWVGGNKITIGENGIYQVHFVYGFVSGTTVANGADLAKADPAQLWGCSTVMLVATSGSWWNYFGASRLIHFSSGDVIQVKNANVSQAAKVVGLDVVKIADGLVSG
jgi:hypothetical protein